jgi:cyclopropane fatty-acyl-phospholipid synthase-like methyltransferase
MSLKTVIVRQIGRPKGLIGGLAGHIMARRSSNRIRNNRTVELMNLKPDSRMLEVGCGPGLALAQCAATATEGRVVGIDHSSVMVKQAEQRLREHGLIENVELFLGGIDRLADWPMAFDRIYSLNVIQFITDKGEYYQKAFGSLALGGMCFTTYQPRLDNSDPNGATRMAEEIERLLSDAGFAEIGRANIKAGATPAVCVYGRRLA